MPRTPSILGYPKLAIGERNFTDEERLKLKTLIGRAGLNQWGTLHTGSGSPYQVPALKIFVPVAIKMIGETGSTNFFNIGYGDTSIGHNNGAAPTTPLYAYNVPSASGLFGNRSDTNTGGNYANTFVLDDEDEDRFEVPTTKYPFIHFVSGSGSIIVYAFEEDV